MRYSIHDKTLAANKARILINAMIDCAKHDSECHVIAIGPFAVGPN